MSIGRMRYLKTNARCNVPSNVMYLDIATRKRQAKNYPWKDEYTFCVAHVRWDVWEEDRYRQISSRFYPTPDDLVARIISRTWRKKPLLVIVSKSRITLPLTGIFDWIDKGRISLESIVDADPPVILKLGHEGCRVKIIDIANYFGESLETMKGVFASCDQTAEDQIVGGNADEIKCEMVTEAIRNAFRSYVEFCRKNDLGNLRYTLASQAMQAYRHRLGPRTNVKEMYTDKEGIQKERLAQRVLPLIHECSDVLRLERLAMFNGETRIFFVGNIGRCDGFSSVANGGQKEKHGSVPKGPIYHLDVNSLFPYVMSRFRYPCKLIAFEDYCELSELKDRLSTLEAVANVMIDSTRNTYPVHHDGKTIYCTGRFWSTLCGQELRFAINNNDVSQCGMVAYYQTADLFSDYVKCFWGLKKQHQEDKQLVMCNLANSVLKALWGKFGQHHQRWVEDERLKPPKRWGRWFEVNWKDQTVTECRAIAGCCQRSHTDEFSANTFPAISACVCANARQYMRILRILLGDKDLYYQGVDSLIVNQAGYDRLNKSGFINRDKLGCLKIVGKYDEGQFINLRNYRLDGVVKLAGLPAAAKPTGDGSYLATFHPSLRTFLETDKGMKVTDYSTMMRFNASYSGGSVGSDGWVTPFRMEPKNARGIIPTGEEQVSDRPNQPGLFGNE